MYFCYKRCAIRADSAARSRESYMKNLKRVVLTLQHDAAKFTRKTLRRVVKMKLAWLYPTKVKTAAVIGVGTVGAGGGY